MPGQWWSEIGLLLDFVGFALLSWDLVKSMAGEREARENLFKIERRAFNARYAVLAPKQEVLQEQREAYDQKEAERRDASEKDMRFRRNVACVAIGLAGVGALMQLYGGYPL